MPSGSKSCSSPSTSRSCRRGNWPCGSPTRKGYFVSEASVYRLLKAHDLITSPAFIVMKAADEFKDKTTAPNQLWLTDFTYLKVTGWGWFYRSTVLDDFSRYIVAWKLCTSMTAGDVTETLNLALQAAGLDQANVIGPGSCPTMGRATSPAIWRNGSKATVCIAVALRIIP
jgi:transposase InsO family protein